MVERLGKRTLFGLAAMACMACFAGNAHAQIYTQSYAAPQAPSGQASYGPAPAGCYTGGPPVGYACYTVYPSSGGYSCYTPGTQPSCPPYTQYPATPCYDTLCHDSATVTQKIVLNRYYPVYIHLKDNHYTGVQIEECWKPLCVLCSTTKPCPKHANGQGGDLPSPVDPNAAGAAPVPVAPSVPTGAPQTSAGTPSAAALAQAAAPTAAQPAPMTVAQPAPAAATPAPSAAPAQTPVSTPDQTTAPTVAQATGPQKRWVYLTSQKVWGLGYQRADGNWVIDSGSMRSAPPAS